MECEVKQSVKKDSKVSVLKNKKSGGVIYLKGKYWGRDRLREIKTLGLVVQ